MKKYFLIITMAVVCSVVRAQQDVDWKILADIAWTPTYLVEYDDYYNMPTFSKKVKALDKKEIIIRGFYVPVDASGTMFALSAYPSNVCFFCGSAGLESVIEVIPKKGESSLKRVATDKYIQLKGKLKLNQKDPDHLMYILEEAELVKIIK